MDELLNICIRKMNKLDNYCRWTNSDRRIDYQTYAGLMNCQVDGLYSVQYNEDGLRRNIHTIFDDTNGNGNSSVCITASDSELREKTWKGIYFI